MKDKLFIFGDYQGFRQSTPLGVDYASVPTALMRQGNFSELLNPAVSGLSAPVIINNLQTGAPFPGNIIPSNLQNPVGVRYLNAYPTPNISGRVQQNYTIQRQQVQNFDDLGRGDCGNNFPIEAGIFRVDQECSESNECFDSFS